jgi:DTW domain-containing protein
MRREAETIAVGGLTAYSEAMDETSARPDRAPPAAIENRIHVLILQHPQEQDKSLGTARLLVERLKNAQLRIGLSWPSLAAALGRAADPHRWAVLYLGSARPAELAPGRAVVALDRKGMPLPDQAAALTGLAGIVLLDGTWSEAKTLWWRNPWLLKLQRVVLAPSAPARYGRLRREPRRDSLSTLEAAALLLHHLDPQPEIAAALEAAIDQLMREFAVERPRPRRRAASQHRRRHKGGQR